MGEVLTFDLGATSGRGIVFSLEEGKLYEKEIYRFKDYQIVDETKEEIYWNVDKLLNEIRNITSIVAEKYEILSIGIDTWGVDFGLLKNGELLMPPLCYQTMLKEKNQHYGSDLPKNFQKITGIANGPVQTSSQLCYIKDHYSTVLEEAEMLLMMPDLLHFLLTGTVASETSMVSTSQLFDIKKMQWADELIEYLGVKREIFSVISQPYMKIGFMNGIPIHSVVEHDTASAIYALPTNEEDIIFLSSGTWSVLGQKIDSFSEIDERYSYELSGDGKILKLKNLLGMWFIEEALPEVDEGVEEIQTILEKEPYVDFFFDSDDVRFKGKHCFVNALRTYGLENGFPKLDKTGKLFMTVYQNLAFKYAEVFARLSSGKTKEIFIFGGGSKAKILNQMTADLTNCDVVVCHSESSSLGNGLAQFIAIKEIKDREELVRIVKNTYELQTFTPKENIKLQSQYKKYQESIKKFK